MTARALPPAMRALASLPVACALLLALLFAPAGAAPEKVAGGIRFTYTNANATSVSWAGLFNNWSPTANPMTKGDGGVWSVVIPLPPGEQQYKFVVDTQWFADPDNGATAGEFGNSVLQIAPDGAIVPRQATSNTPYSAKVLVDGRIIGLYQDIYDPVNTRYELSRPIMDLDLGFGIRFSDVMTGHFLLNIDPEQETVQDYNSRLNFKRGSMTLTQPDLKILAFDSESIGSWDDPLHLVGDIGVFDHPFGYQRQGFLVSTPKLGFQTDILYTDNFENGGTEFPDFQLNRGTGRQFVFETDAVGKSLQLLQTVRTPTGFAIVPDQVAKVTSIDVGDNDNSFGFGDGNKNTFAARVHRDLLGSLRVGLQIRSDRGYDLGRLAVARPVGDSLVQVESGEDEQEWFGGGGDVGFSFGPGIRLAAEYLQGARRMTLVNGSTSQMYAVHGIGALGVTDSLLGSTVADGQHETLDRSSRFGATATWSFAKGDVTLRGGFERENHAYPAWTQPPIPPAGTANTDHQQFENVDYQRGAYLRASEDLENSRTEYKLGWERNWRYYLNREVKSALDLVVTHFEYDPRTAWEYQLWFPTGNMWLENGQHLVGIDRLTVLGQKDVVQLKPSIEIPLRAKRNVLLRWNGDFTGIDLKTQPRYAESVFQFGFDLNSSIRMTTDTRWVKYDAPDLQLSRGFVSDFAAATYRFATGIEVSLGYGIDPNVLDPNTNEYAYVGRDFYLNGRNANGYIAQTNYLSLAPQIAAAEKALQDEKRIQLQAIVHF